MTPPQPHPDLVDRFRADLATVAGPLPERLAVAVSGGPDSVALLLLAAAALPGRITAATVDHGLRAESGDEARQVAELCSTLGCRHDVLKVGVDKGSRGPQAEARAARYSALIGWATTHGLGHLATAHHADDQAETFLMRARRGAGLAGLAGIRAARRDGQVTIVRPLLGWRKAELVSIVAGAGLEAVDDPSNRDARYDRTTVRHLLATQAVLDAARLARSTKALAEAEEALQWTVDRLWRERVSQRGDELVFDHEGLPAAIKRRMLMGMLDAISPGPPRGDAIDRLIVRLDIGGVATLGAARCAGGALWTVKIAPLRRKQN